MKRVIPLLIVLFVLGAFVGTLWFLYQKSQEKPVVFATQTPRIADIVKKTVATGALVPRKEIEIKSRVQGIIDKLHVEPGQPITKGDLIADVSVVPRMVELNQADSRVKAARIAFQNAKRELDRHRSLFEKAVISDAELSKFQLEFELKEQELNAAVANLQIVREGASRRVGQQANTKVRSTVHGMVLDVPVKEGASVIESNSFNPGTTIASVADMNDMIFLGQVDESEVGKLKEGMAIDIKVGALEDEVLKGTLEYIAPKGTESEGVIQFEVKAAIEPKQGVFIRAGYSANANIVIDRRDQVLAISEQLLQFEDGKPYIEVEVAPQTFERRNIDVGLSDGITIEILSGVEKDTKIKKPMSSASDKKAG
ncbi:MAG: efflux RND transporter periplasmic adaptor subunit [Proteobacteria bacterium]|nr:efflux RND transporter periplasmic adaptor subunit [Pseudomonadota bacterium]